MKALCLYGGIDYYHLTQNLTELDADIFCCLYENILPPNLNPKDVVIITDFAEINKYKDKEEL